MEKGTCPWCDHRVHPVSTADHMDKACFQYSDKTPKAIALNPLMCPECCGVFGYEDFYAS
jgi:hypothetical protein